MYTYLASPYSHDDPAVMEERYELTLACAAWMTKKKWIVFSPIVHCHPMAVRHDLPRDQEFWHGYNAAMLLEAREFSILKLDGWKESDGVRAEHGLAIIQEKPISFIDCSGVSFAVADGPEF